MKCNKQCKAYDDEFYVEYCLILEHHVGEDVEAPDDCPKKQISDLQAKVAELEMALEATAIRPCPMCPIKLNLASKLAESEAVVKVLAEKYDYLVCDQAYVQPWANDIIEQARAKAKASEHVYGDSRIVRGGS